VAKYQLNCAPVGHVAAGAGVTFEMRLSIPSTAPAGPNVLRWALVDGRLAVPYASSPIVITT
jgi:hypothetical protein